MWTACCPPSDAHHFATSTSRVRGSPLVELPRGLQRRDPDRLGVDVRVGRLQRDALERRERLAELLALRRVRRACAVARLSHTPTCSAHEPEQRAVEHRARASASPAAAIAERLGAARRRTCRCRRRRRSVVSAISVRRARRRPPVDEEDADGAVIAVVARARARVPRRAPPGTDGFTPSSAPAVPPCASRATRGRKHVVHARPRPARR